MIHGILKVNINLKIRIHLVKEKAEEMKVVILGKGNIVTTSIRIQKMMVKEIVSTHLNLLIWKLMLMIIHLEMGKQVKIKIVGEVLEEDEVEIQIIKEDEEAKAKTKDKVKMAVVEAVEVGVEEVVAVQEAEEILLGIHIIKETKQLKNKGSETWIYDKCQYNQFNQKV